MGQHVWTALRDTYSTGCSGSGCDGLLDWSSTGAAFAEVGTKNGFSGQLFETSPPFPSQSSLVASLPAPVGGAQCYGTDHSGNVYPMKCDDAAVTHPFVCQYVCPLGE